MENDYISREEAKRELLTEATIITDRRFMKTDSAIAVLDLIPAADVVKVIRCLDCKYYYISQGSTKNDIVDYQAYCEYFDIWIGANNYCSKGKRREDEFCCNAERKENET